MRCSSRNEWGDAAITRCDPKLKVNIALNSLRLPTQEEQQMPLATH